MLPGGRPPRITRARAGMSAPRTPACQRGRRCVPPLLAPAHGELGPSSRASAATRAHIAHPVPATHGFQELHHDGRLRQLRAAPVYLNTARGSGAAVRHKRQAVPQLRRELAQAGPNVAARRRGSARAPPPPPPPAALAEDGKNAPERHRGAQPDPCRLGGTTMRGSRGGHVGATMTRPRAYLQSRRHRSLRMMPEGCLPPA